MIIYKLFDTVNSTWMRSEYATLKAASRAADRLDNEYGAYRYSVHRIQTATETK